MPPPDGAASTNRQPDAGGALVTMGRRHRGFIAARSALAAASCAPVQRRMIRVGRVGRSATRPSASARLRPRALAHSRFCTCSRICSISTLSSSDACESSASTDFEPSVLASRCSSCTRKSRRLPALPPGAEHAPHFGHVRAKPRQLLGDVDLGREERELLLQPILVRDRAPPRASRAPSLSTIGGVDRGNARRDARDLRLDGGAARREHRRELRAFARARRGELRRAPGRRARATVRRERLRARPSARPARPASAGSRRRTAARRRARCARPRRPRRASCATRVGDRPRASRRRRDVRRERNAAFDLAALQCAATSRSRSADSSARNSSGSLTVTSR